MAFRLAQELRILRSLFRGLSGEGSHQDRLTRFYGAQADGYDGFRERLLHGRQTLIDELPLAAGQSVVELGGGTGRNLAFFGKRLRELARVEVVDLCAPLLHVARQRLAGHDNVHLIEADATSYQPSSPVDAVYFSYSLTMIPDWFAAIDNALAMLRPGGTVGVVDFYVSRRYPEAGLTRHAALTQIFWPLWFRHDGVILSADHLPYLRRRLDTVFLRESSGPLPYVPMLRVPHYVFIGRKR
ncbi:MAG: class I SAM-dependent methyltransferase [Gammaproteobacteria bacterium]|nr:class I SAM-dependent methyltransferase [Gammaproteobacteria bacterium]